MVVTPIQPSFAAFRGPVDRKVFAPGFVLWTHAGGVLRRLARAVLMLPDRGAPADQQDLPPEFYRFPPL
jgi:hypothetical protein